jgi:hypothetical protein
MIGTKIFSRLLYPKSVIVGAIATSNQLCWESSF